MRIRILATEALIAGLGLFATCAAAGTLEDVIERGFLRCGITENSPGFSTTNAAGEREGFIIDQCKIVSAAVFGKINVDYVPLTPQTAFVSLQARQVDILAAGATWTFLRDTSLGLNYTGVSYFAGQGFMVRRDMDISTVSDLSGATICITQGTTNEQNVADYFSVHGIEFNSLTFRDMELALAAYDDERCDAVTNERLSLAGRMKTLRKPSEHLILTESISKEPVGALVRHGDDRWLDIVFWAFNVRSAAEELGINQANVAQQRRDSRSPEVRRLLGLDGEFGRNLGLPNDWSYQIIRLVGNYADIWNRNFAPLGVERGLNELWSNGGLLSALPFR